MTGPGVNSSVFEFSQVGSGQIIKNRTKSFPA